MKKIHFSRWIIALFLIFNQLHANSEVIASFNGENLTIEELAQRANRTKLNKSDIIAKRKDYTTFINAIIDEKLLAQNVLQNNLISNEMIQDDLKALEIKTLAKEYDKYLLHQSEITLQEMEKFYKQNKANMKTLTQYRTLFIPFKENNIYANNIPEDAKNAKDKITFLKDNNAIDKILTKNDFADAQAFGEFSKIKKTSLSKSLINLGNEYYLFYIRDIGDSKELTFEESKRYIDSQLRNQKANQKRDKIFAKFKETAKITRDAEGLPTINSLKWDSGLIDAFFKEDIKKFQDPALDFSIKLSKK